MKGMLDIAQQGITQNNQYASEFGSAANAMESTGRNALSAQTQMANAQSVIMDTDYAKVSSDFNKTDLMSQIAMIVQSQANAVQSRAVPLLS